jgi:hypothetical protein
MTSFLLSPGSMEYSGLNTYIECVVTMAHFFKRDVSSFHIPIPERVNLGWYETRAPFYLELYKLINLVVTTVFDILPQVVLHAARRCPPEEVLVDVDAHHFIGCQEAVGDALFQAVGVNR